VFAIALVLVAEIINTVVEDLCNKVEPAHDSVIAKIKDTSGAFVLVASMASATIAILVYLNHFN
jgi:diacylglycerol kinase